MITVLLLDLDGVLRIWDPLLTEAVETAYGLPRDALREAACDPPRLEAALTGEMDDRAWRAAVADDVARRYGEQARPAVDEWLLPPGHVDPEALEVVRRARTRLRVMLFTNATSRLADDLDRLGLVDEVDGVLSSTDLGLAKPDPDVFSAAAVRTRLLFREIAYVDTSLANIATAEVLGIRSHRYRDVQGLGEFVDELLEPAPVGSLR